MPTVLIVDDSPGVRHALRRLFTGAGLNVIDCDTADQAFAIVQQGGVDVVITDECLPKRHGLKLLRLVREARPEVHRILLSGSIKSAEIEITKDVYHRFFAKPWDNVELLQAVKDALELRAENGERL